MSSDNLSRRAFLKTAAAGAAVIGLSGGESHASQAPKESDGDLVKLSIAEAAELVRKRKVSPVELTKACLARIEQINPALNCFITVTAEAALAQAREAEGEIQRGKWRGPLHGIPVALKDLFDTAGVKTTAGSALFKDRVPTEDAEVVRRLKAAGAVLAGKTNLHEFAYGGNSVVTYFGAVRNPWNPAYIAGGSSGGSAAAVAGGLCYGALGSDTAGSVRMPAAFCANVGLKPTYGLVSNRGVIPLSWSLDHVGPMTRTVEDAALMLQAIAGYDPADTSSVRMNVPDYRSTLHRKTSALRVGIARAFFFDGLDAEIEAAVKNALAVLEKLTASVKDVVLPSPPDQQESVRGAVRAAEAYVYHYEWVNKTPELYQPETLLRVKSGAEVTTLAYIQGRRDLAQARRAIEPIFDSVDLLVTPTTPVMPPTIADVSRQVETSTSMIAGANFVRNTAPFDVWGIPAVSVPCGFAHNGLPIGLHIAGANGRDAVALQLAAAYERATEWHKRRPDVGRATVMP